MSRPRLASFAPLLALALGCASPHSASRPGMTHAGRAPHGAPAPMQPAQPAPVALAPVRAVPDGYEIPGATYHPPAQRLSRAQLASVLPSGPRLTPDALLAAHRVAFEPVAPVDPGPVPGMREIQGGRFSLTDAELALLRTQRFAFSTRHSFPNFMTGYAMLYIADQPVYLSADAVLNPLHLSFDSLLADLEEHALGPAIERALATAHGALASSSLSPETRTDLDLYLAIALSLLRGRPVAPAAGASANTVNDAYAAAQAAARPAPITLFGAERDVDFSQFRPRGHYVGVAARERYFRAVMWLGREGVRVVDSVNGRPVLSRRSVAGALGLVSVMPPEGRSALALVDTLVTSFAGEGETLGVRDVEQLAQSISSRGGLASIDDAALSRMIDAQRGDRPRIATTLLHHPEGAAESSFEPVAFSLSPQRYTPDSLVLSRVSYDRIQGGRVLRMMPEALDAAFGALGNDQAAALLEPSLRRYDFATELSTVRSLVDAHESAYWGGSLYARWLGALRTLSPRETLGSPAGLPTVMRSDAWGRRLLNTQLSAWSEMRHDLVLYLAQSYSAEPGCSYPAAYVDPYPAFWNALGQWAAGVEGLIQQAPWADTQARDRWLVWARHARSVVAQIEGMAQRERAGQELTPEQLAYMNQALNARVENVVCTTVTRVDAGWYYDLFAPRLQLGDQRAMVADVHTQPSDENGVRVGHVLHVGTMDPRTFVVIAGPEGRQRAYVGIASSYAERVTSNFERLTDEQWRGQASRAQEPAWLRSVTGR